MSRAESPESFTNPAGMNPLRLKAYFAVLSCLGGLVLASAEGAEQIPAIALFFAVFGFVFVDWLKLMALPAILAYVAMGIAAVYCVSDFWSVAVPGNQQMLSVARLLVLVQAILMVQEKTVRIYEQLAVFCLLQLVVAAVFNDTINYVVLVALIGVFGAMSLVLLSCVNAAEGVAVPKSEDPRQKVTMQTHALTAFPRIQVTSTSSVSQLSAASEKLPRFVLLTVTPAVVVIGAVFFYTLPRRSDAARMEGRGKTLVGFNDSMRLEQIGQMLRSSEPALRVKMTDRRTGKPYRLSGSVYLRGQVLELYSPVLNDARPTATWSSVLGPNPVGSGLPAEYIPDRRSDNNFYDSVLVNVSCESMRSPALFSIPPYYRSRDDNRLTHTTGTWTLARQQQSLLSFPRVDYQFMTHALHQGVQGDLIAVSDQSEVRFAPRYRLSPLRSLYRRTAFGASYMDHLLGYDEVAMPAVMQLAERIIGEIPEKDRGNTLAVATALQNHLSSSADFQYTLNLNANPQSGMDPIQQFLSSDRRGHCQYFSSALVMMLRSQNIPARIVVGYRTDEFNELGQHYMARQSHAHAWVEALIDRSELDDDRVIYGQPEAEKYWLRLDPTPGGGGIDNATKRGVEKVLDFAQKAIKEYIIDMDAERQNSAFTRSDTSVAIGGSFAGWMQRKLASIQAGNLGGGSFAVKGWQLGAAFLLLLGLTFALFVLAKLKFRNGFRFQRHRKRTLVDDKPRVLFYAESLQHLEKLGLVRQPAQTPSEFSRFVGDRMQQVGESQIAQTFQAITTSFCGARYGHHRETEVGDSELRKLAGQVKELLTKTGARKLDLTRESLSME